MNKLKHFLNFKVESVWINFLSFLIHKLNCPAKRLGSAYGGWTICPIGLNFKSIIYSFGIGEDISFDLALIEKFRCRVFAFDPTPRSIEWLKQQELPHNFKWFEIGIADYDGKAKFFPPENTSFVSHTILKRPQTANKAIVVNVRRLSTILNELSNQRIDILKMDIEGAEYKVIDDMLSTNVRPAQILVEFHHFFKNVSLLRTIHSTINMWMHGYRLFSLSKSGHEYSFIFKGKV